LKNNHAIVRRGIVKRGLNLDFRREVMVVGRGTVSRRIGRRQSFEKYKEKKVSLRIVKKEVLLK